MLSISCPLRSLLCICHCEDPISQQLASVTDANAFPAAVITYTAALPLSQMMELTPRRDPGPATGLSVRKLQSWAGIKHLAFDPILLHHGSQPSCTRLRLQSAWCRVGPQLGT